MTMLRLTDAGRAALADPTNRQLNNVQLRSFAIGDGTGPGGEGDDSRTDLRSEQNREDLTGTTMVAGRLAVRASFVPTSTYSVTEAGIVARIGDAGAEFLLAYWAVDDAANALATTVSGVTLIVAGVLDITHAAAEVNVTVSADITFGGPGTLIALTDMPDQFDADKYLRANNAATAGIWDEAPPVVATEAALPAPAAAVQGAYRVEDYNGTGHPVLALLSGDQWRYAYSVGVFAVNSKTEDGLTRLAEDDEHTQANPPSDKAATPSGVRAVWDALLGGVGAAYDTLAEIAAELASGATARAALMTAIAGKVAKAGDTMTGDLLTVTPADGDNSKKAVNSEWVRRVAGGVDVLGFFSRSADLLLGTSANRVEFLSGSVGPVGANALVGVLWSIGIGPVSGVDRNAARLHRGATALTPDFTWGSRGPVWRRQLFLDKPGAGSHTYTADGFRRSGITGKALAGSSLTIFTMPNGVVADLNTAETSIAQGDDVLSVQITPRSATAEIKLNMLAIIGSDPPGGSSPALAGVSLRLKRGSATLVEVAEGQLTERDDEVLPSNFEDWIDEPATTNPVTYTLEWRHATSVSLRPGSYLMAAEI